MTRVFRGTDLVAHMGSLRFAVLLSNTKREGAEIARARLLKSLPDGSLRAGLACHPGDGDDWRTLLEAAGAAGDIELVPGDWDDELPGSPRIKGGRTVA